MFKNDNTQPLVLTKELSEGQTLTRQQKEDGYFEVS